MLCLSLACAMVFLVIVCDAGPQHVWPQPESITFDTVLTSRLLIDPNSFTISASSGSAIFERAAEQYLQEFFFPFKVRYHC